MMRTILLILEYDGTNYAGWQVQPNGQAVQEVVESALAQLLGQSVRVHSSGRTDAGVHALGMPAHFQTEATLPLKAFRDGVNRFLPMDVVVREAREMSQDFHARFAAKHKWYRYTIYLGDVRSPLASRTSWHLRRSLDLDTMKKAASHLVGCHDFQAFRSSSCVAKTTQREILSCEVTQEGDFVYLDVRGTGFLKNMVRMIAGTIVEIGIGKRPHEDIVRLLESDSEQRIGATAPPQGLCLMEVVY